MGGCESHEAPPPKAASPSPQRDAPPSPSPAPVTGVGAPITGDARVGAFVIRMGADQEMSVLRAESKVKGGKRCIGVVEPEVVCASYVVNPDGDGDLRAFAGVDRCAGWTVELQFINVGENKRTMDICMNGKRMVQLRVTPKGPVAIGYGEPFPSEESKITYPDPSEGNPYFYTCAPESVGGDALATFKQGMFNIVTIHEGQTHIVATVRSQLDRSIAVQVVRQMDFAIAIAFAVARTWLE